MQKVCAGNRRFGRVELGGGPFGIRIHKGRLVNAANPLDGADVKSVLATEITWMIGFNLSAGFIILPFALSA